MTFELQVLRSHAEFPALKAAWQNLEAATAEPCFFQSYAWCGHLAEVLHRTNPDRYEAFVAVATTAGSVVALWPMSRQKRAGIWELRALDDPFGQFAGLIYADPSAAQFLVDAALSYVRDRRLADVVILDRVLEESPLFSALQAYGATCRSTVGAPAIETRCWPSFADLKSSRNKKTMKNLRNATNRLSKVGPWQHRATTSGAETLPIISATLRQRTAWLETKGMTAPQFRSAAHEQVLMRGQSWGMDAARIGFELSCEGRSIARQWGFRHQKRYYAFMSSTDPEFSHLSPGRVHLAFVIEEAMRQGMDALELLTPAANYKMIWTDNVRQLHNLALPLSTKGWVRDRVWDRSLRPAAKACYYALPIAMRWRTSSLDHTHSDAE